MGIDPAPELRGTTVQVCGLWPFAAGASAPVVGTPLGKDLINAGTVCCDPVSWFTAQLIDQPSAFILGKPGLGKSSLSRRMLIGLMHRGVVPIVMADLKPDYVDLFQMIRAKGGEADVIHVGPERDAINPLDPGPVLGLIAQMPADQARKVWGEILLRQAASLGSLIALVRQTSLRAKERTILQIAIRELNAQYNPPTDGSAGPTMTGQPAGRRIPLVGEVLDHVRNPSPAMQAAALDRGDRGVYDREIEGLEEGLMALGPDGPFGQMFSQPTTKPIRLGVPTCFDVSSIDDNDETLLQAATQAVCWSYASSAVSAAAQAAEAGVGVDHTHFLVMDELWRILRAWSGMVDLVDAITRLNRQKHLGQVMITHTMNDLVLETDALTRRAWGFVERSALVFIGGLADAEMGNLRQVFALSDRETAMIRSWSEQGRIDPQSGRAVAPPGQGRFLLKRGKSPGTPFHVQLTLPELAVNDTNKRWNELRHHQVPAATVTPAIPDTALELGTALGLGTALEPGAALEPVIVVEPVIAPAPGVARADASKPASESEGGSR